MIIEVCITVGVTNCLTKFIILSMRKGRWEKILCILRIFSENVYTNVVQHTVYEDGHFKILPSILSFLAITSSCSGPPQRQSELLALRICKRGGRTHVLPMCGLARSSCCSIFQWLPVPMPIDALGKEGMSFLWYTGGGKKGDRRKEL